MKSIIRTFPSTLKMLSGNRQAVLLSLSIVSLGILSSTIYAAIHLQQSPTQSMDDAMSKSTSNGSGSLNTVSPTLISDNSSVLILGSVISHETANIYPRRDGIVEDVYVDIGDTVTKGQVVALLLPKGVEGQGATAIAEKRARQAQVESDLVSAQAVKEQVLMTTEQKILEKETELQIAQSEQRSLLEKFAMQEKDISQARDQLFTTIQSARQLIEHVLTASNSRSGEPIYEEDLVLQLGNLNPQTRYDVIPPFDQLYTKEQAFASMDDYNRKKHIEELIALALDALTRTHDLLSATPTVPNPQSGMYTHAQLNTQMNQVLTMYSTVLKAKERLEDVESDFDILIASEPSLYQAYRSGNFENAKSNKVSMLETQLNTSKQGLNLAEANQQQIVERQKAMLDIATTQLNSEYVQSGHRQIQSPFSGTVSKRFITVGQIVMPSVSAFELTDVPTSLAKRAKAEVQFGLPERLQDAINVDDAIAFFLQSDETKEHSAVVTRKSPQIDLQTQTVTVQAKLSDDDNLPHQTSVRIRITDTNTPVFRIPSSSVKREDDRNYIWILDEYKTPQQVTISVVSEEGEFAELTGNISEESLVILDPPALFVTRN